MEQRTHCGEKGYWKSLGLYYCQKFLFREKEFATETQKWLPASRLCLQKRAQNLAVQGLTCKQMWEEALDSHVNCYVDTGFCNLPAREKNKVYWHLSSTLTYPEIWKQAIKIRQHCHQTSY